MIHRLYIVALVVALVGTVNFFACALAKRAD